MAPLAYICHDDGLCRLARCFSFGTRGGVCACWNGDAYVSKCFEEASFDLSLYAGVIGALKQLLG